MLDVAQVKEKVNEDAANELRLCLRNFEVLFILFYSLSAPHPKGRSETLKLESEMFLS